CEDYLVSHLPFQIVKCSNCELLFTNPRPNRNQISKYYQSENYISHSNSKKTFFDRVYQTVRKKAIQKKIRLIENLKPKGKIILNLLSHEGYLIIAVPNYLSFDATHYKNYWAAYDVPRHLYHFSPHVIKSILKKEGISFHKSLPMKFDSYYVSMLSEKNKKSS